MNLPRYWARGEFQARLQDGRVLDMCAFGWSSVSLEDARQVGEERARRAAERMTSGNGVRGRTGGGPEAKREYEYADIPPREEILDRIVVEDREIGLLTRNGYGAIVLNTDCVLFVDIDRSEGDAPKPSGGLLGRLFSPPPATPPVAPPDPVEDRIAAWSARNPEASFRLYRTCAGWRLLFTDGLYEPRSERVRGIFEELGADRLYARLTDRQGSFRARLTPKPWRVGFHAPADAVRYPFLDEKAERLMRRWEEEYSRKARGHTTCLAPRLFGPPAAPVVAIERVIAYHDHLACLGGDRLA
jgi:hypothetical protein